MIALLSLLHLLFSVMAIYLTVRELRAENCGTLECLAGSLLAFLFWPVVLVYFAIAGVFRLANKQ